MEEIVRILKLKRSLAPRRPPRILLMGPPGCGKSYHAKKVAEKYKLAYIRTSTLVKDMIRRDSSTSTAKEIKEKLENSHSSILILSHSFSSWWRYNKFGKRKNIKTRLLNKWMDIRWVSINFRTALTPQRSRYYPTTCSSPGIKWCSGLWENWVEKIRSHRWSLLQHNERYSK